MMLIRCQDPNLHVNLQNKKKLLFSFCNVLLECCIFNSVANYCSASEKRMLHVNCFNEYCIFSTVAHEKKIGGQKDYSSQFLLFLELESDKQPNTLNNSCFYGVCGVELKNHRVGRVELFFLELECSQTHPI